MSRKQPAIDSILDDLFAVLKLAPWWAGPIAIAAVWMGLALLLPAVLQGATPQGGSSPSRAFGTSLAVASRTFAPLAAIAVTMVWLFALIAKHSGRRRLDAQRGLDTIRNLSWKQFEQLLAEAFRRQGYSVMESDNGPDGGIDLIIRKDDLTTLVQAKHWKTRRVGVRVVRETAGVRVGRQADNSMVITSGDFTDAAIAEADRNGTQLISGRELWPMIESVQRGRQSGSHAPSPHGAISPSRSASITAPTSPACPVCNEPMVRRVARRGAHAGNPFWGCPRYPNCHGKRPIA